MTEYAFRYLPVAVDDVNEIVKWYRDQKAGLENEFLENLENALLKIALNPINIKQGIRNCGLKS